MAAEMIIKILPGPFPTSDVDSAMCDSGELYQGSSPQDWGEAWRELDVIVTLISYPSVTVPPLKLHVQWPIEDGVVPGDTAALWALVRFIANLVHAGKKVLVHCGMGINRSGFIGALVCRELLRCNGSQALDFVRARRPGSVLNPNFVTFLNRLGGLK